MRILPVLDLMQGQVVRGVGGRRHEYRAVTSKWTQFAQPLALSEALSGAFGFRSFYLADLDAIAGQPPNCETYHQLLSRGFHLAVDAGIHHESDGRRVLETGADCVVGLETVAGPAVLQSLIESDQANRVLFSLDLHGGKPLGNRTAWLAFDPWSLVEQAVDRGFRRVIILDLAHVGTGQGVPTLDLCRRIKREYAQVELITGGGVSGVTDLQRLEDVGVDWALVASALHDGRLEHDEVRRFGWLED